MPKPKNGKVRTKSPLPFRFKALDGKKYQLTSKQKAWCDIYLQIGVSLTIASLETYDVTNKHLCKIPWKLLSVDDRVKRTLAENMAARIGTENIRKHQLVKYIDKVLSDEGYTEKKVQLKHFKNIMQDESISASNQAIDMYYKKKGAYAPEEIKHGINESLKEFLDKQNKKLP